jgi:hypothetical protein
MEQEQIKSWIEKRIGWEGRMISGSKSGYMKRNPGNEVYFNANIFVLGEGKIWWGDLDLTKDREVLTEISASCGKKFYILIHFLLSKTLLNLSSKLKFTLEDEEREFSTPVSKVLGIVFLAIGVLTVRGVLFA